MPVGYLVLVTFIAWSTLCAVAPLQRPRALALLTWGSGLVLNELPFLALFLLAASTALAIGDGEVDSTAGWVVVGIAALTAVGLGVVVRRALRTRPVVDRALRDGLGDGWRGSLDAGAATHRRGRAPVARILFGPFAFQRRDVERVSNLGYGNAGRRNLLDVYRHRSHPAGCPTLVHLHGGRFRHGTKSREARPLLTRLASQGWVCISANYRLSPAVWFPEHLIDVKKVIAWIWEHGPEYGADPAVVFVSGSSAGAHLAAMAALTAGDPAFQPGFETADTSVTAAVGLYGFYGALDTDGGPPSSPGAYVTPDAPPFFVAHGDHDTYVPVAGARAFVADVRSGSSNPVVYAELPGGQHSFDLFHSIRFEAVVDGIEAFAAWVRSRGVTVR